jgi:hypothetical protein
LLGAPEKCETEKWRLLQFFCLTFFCLVAETMIKAVRAERCRHHQRIGGCGSKPVFCRQFADAFTLSGYHLYTDSILESGLLGRWKDKCVFAGW